MLYNKLSPYEKYKLNWMIDHGYLLQKLIDVLQKIQDEAEPGTTIQEAYALFESEYGFDGSLWGCYEEWKMNEGTEREE